MRVRVEQFEKKSGLKCWEDPTPNAPPRQARIVGIERDKTALVGRNNSAHWFEDPVRGHSVPRAEAWQRFNASHGPSTPVPVVEDARPQVAEAPVAQLRLTPLERVLARFFR